MQNLAHLKAAARNKLPGDPGVWIFIIADTFSFCLFFMVFIAGRYEQPEVYEQSRQALNATVGLINTLVLLTSSWLIVLAVDSARNSDRKNIRKFLGCTFMTGIGFATLKFCSYVSEVQSGHLITTDQFFAYYYAFTLIHFMHVIIGLIAISITYRKAKTDRLDSKFICWIESVASYWHMVDLLWIVLFPMLYLLEAK